MASFAAETSSLCRWSSSSPKADSALPITATSSLNFSVKQSVAAHASTRVRSRSNSFSASLSLACAESSLSLWGTSALATCAASLVRNRRSRLLWHSKSQSGSSMPQPTKSSWQETTTSRRRLRRCARRCMPRAMPRATGRSTFAVNSSRTNAWPGSTSPDLPSMAAAACCRMRAKSARDCSPLLRAPYGRMAALRLRSAAPRSSVAEARESKWESTGASGDQSMVGLGPKKCRARVLFPEPEGPVITPMRKSSMGGNLGILCRQRPSKGQSSNRETPFSFALRPPSGSPT
mmetsp:Transcript_63152/g.199487  ORF Transcript_63152/g.199487 Transcript_63152/m.199487 type:complete len:291 (-) Transcript_63152:1079-1951(-)